MVLPAPPAPPALELASAGMSSGTFPASGEGAAPVAPTRLSARARTLNVLAGRSVLVSGRLLSTRPSLALAGRMITLQRRAQHGWRTLARTRTSTNGRYRLRLPAERAGSEALRLRFAGDVADAASHRRLGELNVYRLAEASWYGGGGSLACGGALTGSTLGVASKTLPCGMLLTLRYRRRTIRVPVIDRGPYVAGRELDLTEATKQALGFGDTGEVWSTA